MNGVSYTRDTIAAIATAPGRGGIGIIRVSGPGVIKVAEALTGRLPEPRYATFTPFRDEDGTVIDQGIALYFKGPDSFTGEDVIEFQGHGGPVVLDLLLNRVVSAGARIAEPGEFSKRAFLNDKIDLAQAEAIADLISSGTREAARSAMRSLAGVFSERVHQLLVSVTELRVYVEAAIDFPEEEIDFLSDANVLQQLKTIDRAFIKLLEEATEGALLSEGASVVLTGRPNAGKSSLMNLMTGRETSIVTEIPGTTRDIVNETLQLDGIPLRLVDTAGIRETQDLIETEGVRRAEQATAQADLVIAMVDATEENWLSDLRALGERSGGITVRVCNKVDLLESEPAWPDDVIPVSVKTGEGIERLKEQLKRCLGIEGSSESGFTARSRHVDALRRAAAAVARGQDLLELEQAGELLAEELRICQQCLSEITGEFSADDLLGEIFSSFCVGK